MDAQMQYECAGCAYRWRISWTVAIALATRVNNAGITVKVPADVSPCCGNATINMRTGEQIFLTSEEAAALRQDPNS